MVTRLAIVYLLQTSLVSPGAALLSRASNEGYAQVCEDFTITEKAPAMAGRKILLGHYAKQKPKQGK